MKKSEEVNLQGEGMSRGFDFVLKLLSRSVGFAGMLVIAYILILVLTKEICK